MARRDPPKAVLAGQRPAHLPKVRRGKTPGRAVVTLVAPVSKLLQEIQVAAGRELALIQREQTAPDAKARGGRAKALHDLAAAVARSYEADQAVQADLQAEMRDKTDEELAAEERRLNGAPGDSPARRLGGGDDE